MKKLSILLSLCLALALGGCSMLREEAAPAEEDRLVGIYVTPEYIDTFDLEAYFEDNASQLLSGGGGEISAEDAEEYSQRIYATNNGGREGELEFPIWGVPLVCARYGEGEESYVGGRTSLKAARSPAPYTAPRAKMYRPTATPSTSRRTEGST